ncbi:MAG: hypothetical protein OHK0026_01860 [Rhodocyclaceae bacterium]
MARHTTGIVINGRDVWVEWSESAAAELARRSRPLVVELELYFSCLVKKFVRFHEDAGGRQTVAASEKLLFYFRPVTSTGCSFELAERLGRQPETELSGEAVRRIAPKSVNLDFAGGAWRGSYRL